MRNTIFVVSLLPVLIGVARSKLIRVNIYDGRKLSLNTANDTTASHKDDSSSILSARISASATSELPPLETQDVSINSLKKLGVSKTVVSDFPEKLDHLSSDKVIGSNGSSTARPNTLFLEETPVVSKEFETLMGITQAYKQISETTAPPNTDSAISTTLVPANNGDYVSKDSDHHTFYNHVKNTNRDFHSNVQAFFNENTEKTLSNSHNHQSILKQEKKDNSTVVELPFSFLSDKKEYYKSTLVFNGNGSMKHHAKVPHNDTILKVISTPGFFCITTDFIQNTEATETCNFSAWFLSKKWDILRLEQVYDSVGWADASPIAIATAYLVTALLVIAIIIGIFFCIFVSLKGLNDARQSCIIAYNLGKQADAFQMV